MQSILFKAYFYKSFFALYLHIKQKLESLKKRNYQLVNTAIDSFNDDMWEELL